MQASQKVVELFFLLFVSLEEALDGWLHPRQTIATGACLCCIEVYLLCSLHVSLDYRFRWGLGDSRGCQRELAKAGSRTSCLSEKDSHHHDGHKRAVNKPLSLSIVRSVNR